MKILILDEEFPFPTNSGKRTRSFNLYRRLASMFDIRYIAYGHPDSESANAMRAEGMRVSAVPARVAPKEGAQFYLRLLANLASPLPYIVDSHYSRIYEDVVRRSLAEERPDLVLCEWTPYTIYVKELADVTKLVSTHNIEADIWRRYYETEKNAPRRWYIGKQWEKVERFEKSSLGWVDGAMAVSDLDSDRLRSMAPGLPVRTVPNGVDLRYFDVLEPPSDAQHLVFTGSMDWRPNQDAAHYFVREIWPSLKKNRPNLHCTFVGRSPPADVLALAGNGIEITGTVDDVRPYVRRAAVYVVPLRVGGGSRLKILEALSMGRPVISTTVGAEGLDVTDGKDIVLADTAQAFMEGVESLLDSPARRNDLATQGRRLVEMQYGWDAVARHCGEFLEDLVSRSKAKGKASP